MTVKCVLAISTIQFNINSEYKIQVLSQSSFSMVFDPMRLIVITSYQFILAAIQMLAEEADFSNIVLNIVPDFLSHFTHYFSIYLAQNF